jgi:hypothetical protein
MQGAAAAAHVAAAAAAAAAVRWVLMKAYSPTPQVDLHATAEIRLQSAYMRCSSALPVAEHSLHCITKHVFACEQQLFNTRQLKPFVKSR